MTSPSRLSVKILSRYGRLGASSRLRSFQFLPFLQEAGFDLEVLPLFGDDYVSRLYSGQLSRWTTLRSLAARLSQPSRLGGADAVIVEKELFPWLPWLFERVFWPRSMPVIVDYDDAIFHNYDMSKNPLIRWSLGTKIARVMRKASAIHAGNAYLADYAARAQARRVEIIPTVVDHRVYSVRPRRTAGGAVRLGWIGTPITWAAHGRALLRILAPLLEGGDAVLQVIGGRMVAGVEGPVEYLPWSEEAEVGLIQALDVGLMPLGDDPWSRGKCGYKLIQYMACGIPVVATPVGANNSIVEPGVSGFLCDTPEAWIGAISRLVADEPLRSRMGAAGRARVEAEFSIAAVAPKVAGSLRQAINARRPPR